MPTVVGFRATIIPIKLLHSYGFNQPNHGCYGLGRTVPIAAPVAHRTRHDGLVLGNHWNHSKNDPKWKPFCCNCIFCVNNLVFNLRIVLILVASSHVESTSSNSRWLSSPPWILRKECPVPSNGAKPKGGSQISPPQIAADPAIAHDLIYPKAAQIHDDSPVSTIFRHSFRWILDISSSALMMPQLHGHGPCTMAYHGRFRKLAAKGRNAAAVFGSSPEALLHQDLLPLLASVKGDEGGRAGGTVFLGGWGLEDAKNHKEPIGKQGSNESRAEAKEPVFLEWCSFSVVFAPIRICDHTYYISTWSNDHPCHRAHVTRDMASSTGMFPQALESFNRSNLQS